MAETYWLGDVFVDLSRNQITQNGESKTLPPKVLAVLTHLAKHQGKVVTHDELLSEVWQGTIVSPNSLQRCVAQLRKALSDTTKPPSIIKTHAKKGYSLEVPVRWHKDVGSNRSDEVSEQAHSRTSLPGVYQLVFIALFAVLGTWVVSELWPEPELSLTVKSIRPLTSTDDRELASIYSPDGQYIIFKRFPEILCENNLWAKHIDSQQEFQLTNKLGNYGSPAFSEDGKTLAFIYQSDCESAPGLTSTQKHCYQLQSLDFQQARRATQSPTTLMECKNSQIRDARWVSDDSLTFLQKHHKRWELTLYTLNSKTSSTLFAPTQGNLITYDFSTASRKLAVIEEDAEGTFFIAILNTQGDVLSRHPIDYPDNIAQFRHIHPRFSAKANQLIFSTGKQLFTLSENGEIREIDIAIDDRMGTPVFHPDGKRMLAIKGHYDSDAMSLPLPNPLASKATTESDLSKFVSIDRSIYTENRARFQPGGQQIAYVSGRSGTRQVWLYDGEGSTQLSDYPLDTYIDGLLWAKDGSSILASGSGELTQFFLDGRIEHIPLAYPVERVFDWGTQQQTVLAKARLQGVSTFVEIDLNNHTTREINGHGVFWADKEPNQTFVFMDEQHRYWQLGQSEYTPILALQGQGSSKRFVLHRGVIYGINDSMQLWSYHLNDEIFTVLTSLPDTVDAISDINDSHMLLTVRVAARKEVIELSVE